jgi:hypothetical protein
MSIAKKLLQTIPTDILISTIFQLPDEKLSKSLSQLITTLKGDRLRNFISTLDKDELLTLIDIDDKMLQPAIRTATQNVARKVEKSTPDITNTHKNQITINSDPCYRAAARSC